MNEFYNQSFTSDNCPAFDEFTNAEFDSCHFTGITFDQISFKSSVFIDCVFESCSFFQVNLLNTRIRTLHFKESKLSGLNWSDCNCLEDIIFDDCKLDLSVFQSLELRNFCANNTSLKEVDFSGSDLTGAKIINCNTIGCLFNGAKLNGADLTGSGPVLIDPKFTKLKNTKIDLAETSNILKLIGVIVS
jgi:uncharacterized protein YjbI with pentapeptide repeats